MLFRIKNLTTWSKMLLLVWSVIFLTSNMPGVLEGRIWPVIIDMQINAGNSFPFSNISGSYTKNRICDLEEIRWYIVGSNGFKVRIKTNDIPIDENFFAPGTQNFGPIEVKLPSKFLIENSEVQIVSNCHPLWYTISTIYP